MADIYRRGSFLGYSDAPRKASSGERALASLVAGPPVWSQPPDGFVGWDGEPLVAHTDNFGDTSDLYYVIATRPLVTKGVNIDGWDNLAYALYKPTPPAPGASKTEKQAAPRFPLYSFSRDGVAAKEMVATSPADALTWIKGQVDHEGERLSVFLPGGQYVGLLSEGPMPGGFPPVDALSEAREALKEAEKALAAARFRLALFYVSHPEDKFLTKLKEIRDEAEVVAGYAEAVAFCYALASLAGFTLGTKATLLNLKSLPAELGIDFSGPPSVFIAKADLDAAFWARLYGPEAYMPYMSEVGSAGESLVGRLYARLAKLEQHPYLKGMPTETSLVAFEKQLQDAGIRLPRLSYDLVQQERIGADFYTTWALENGYATTPPVLKTKDIARLLDKSIASMYQDSLLVRVYAQMKYTMLKAGVVPDSLRTILRKLYPEVLQGVMSNDLYRINEEVSLPIVRVLEPGLQPDQFEFYLNHLKGAMP